MNKVKYKTIIRIGVLVLVVVCLVVINIKITERNYNLYGDYYSESEYLPTVDLLDYLDEHGEGKYKVSFELRAEKPGEVLVSIYDNNTAKYWITKNIVEASTEYTTYEIDGLVSLINEKGTASHLVFHGTYGTGVVPAVRNIKIEKIEEAQDE